MVNWRDGEDLAAEHLEKEGWKVVARNFRSRRGEIDIVAARGKTLAFVEVKTWRAAAMDELEYSMNSRKKNIYIRVSKYFLVGRREFDDYFGQFEVLYVDASNGRVKHLEHAFTENF